jgi:hypothetical protein
MGMQGSHPTVPSVIMSDTDIPIESIEYCIAKDSPISDVLQLYLERYHSDESVIDVDTTGSESVEV